MALKVGGPKGPCVLVILVICFLMRTALPACAEESETFANASWWGAVFPADKDSRAAIDKKTNLLVELLDLPPGMPFEQKIDAVRMFVWGHSVHQIDDEFYSYWPDMPQMMSRLAANALNYDSPPPHMECATRSAMMYRILDRLKIRARLVILRPSGEALNDAHTIVEVENPATKQWEITDPDLNIYWIFNDGSGRRAGVRDMLVYPLPASVTPCRKADDCGYTAQDNGILSRFSYANLLDLQRDENTLLINKSRFGLGSRFLLTNHNILPTCVLFGDKCRKTIISLDEKPDLKSSGKP